MTGRRGRVVKTEKQPQPHYEARESDSSNVDSLNIQEVRILLEVKKKTSTSISRFFFLGTQDISRLKYMSCVLPRLSP